MQTTAFAQQDIKDSVSLVILNITGKQDNLAKNIIKEIIENREKNSLKHLGNYSFKEYSKIWIDSYKHSFPKQMKTPQDSLQLENWIKTENSFDFLIEKGTKHYFNKKYGEKIKTEACRISGIRTPLVELAAIDPLPYDLKDDTFNFFYLKKFINPISKFGILHYQYRIADTLQHDSLRLIRIFFKTKKEVETPLYGNLFIEEKTKAITYFSAEYDYGSDLKNNNAQRGRNYEIESIYKPYSGVWAPYKQRYKVTIYNKKRDAVQNEVFVEKTFKDFNTEMKFSAKDFYGYKNELTDEAFKNFDKNIVKYRDQPLTEKERKTYLYVDEKGKKIKIDWLIKEARVMVNGLNLPLGKVDFMLSEVIGGNQYEGFRLGGGLQTNNDFNPNWGVNGKLGYGFSDKK